MSSVERVSLQSEGIINLHIDSLWKLLTDDWENQDWWGNEMEKDESSMVVARTFLEGEKGKVPRTKVIERANAEGNGLPVQNRETLLHEDPIAYRLFYNASDGFLPGLRNYMASWSLDELPDGRTQMNISSNLDVMEPGDVSEIKETMLNVYRLIFKGLNDYVAAGKWPRR